LVVIGVMEGRAMSAGVSTYKVDPAPVFLFAYITGSLACAAFVVFLALFDPAFQSANLPAVLETIGYVLVFFGPPYAAMCSLAMSYYFRYDVTPDGVTGQNLLGRTLFVKWTDVASMKPLRVGNLDFVRVSCRSRAATLWLPMFVRAVSTQEPATAIWSMPATLDTAIHARVVGGSGS
jgi:hypothetical protein